MDIDIKDQKENKLLSRLEIQGTIAFTGEATPSNDKVKEAVAKKTGKDAKLVAVKNIYTDYGNASAEVNAYVYDDEKKMKELEETHKKAKGEKKEGEEAAPAAEKPAEAPKEEKKEEAPAEKKEEKPAEEGK